MGYEVRKVPKDWHHPGYAQGKPVPKYDKFLESYKTWIMDGCDDAPPNPIHYMPDWPESERTHFQMYENVSEGTPISPPLPSPEELAKWLVSNKANACGGTEATYEEWLKMIHAGWCPSMAFSPQTGLISGVSAMSKLEE